MAHQAALSRGRAAASLGSGLHVRQRGLPGASSTARGITCSMSRRGNCYDNAVMESFFSTVKTELGEHFESYGTAKEAAVRLHRGVLQPAAPALDARADQPGRVRAPGRRVGCGRCHPRGRTERVHRDLEISHRTRDSHSAHTQSYSERRTTEGHSTDAVNLSTRSDQGHKPLRAVPNVKPTVLAVEGLEPTQHVLYFGLQAKKGKLDAIRSRSRLECEYCGHSQPSADDAWSRALRSRRTSKRVLVDHAFDIVAGGEITKQARNWLQEANSTHRSGANPLHRSRGDPRSWTVVTNLPLPDGAARGGSGTGGDEETPSSMDFPAIGKQDDQVVQLRRRQAGAFSSNASTVHGPFPDRRRRRCLLTLAGARYSNYFLTVTRENARLLRDGPLRLPPDEHLVRLMTGTCLHRGPDPLDPALPERELPAVATSAPLTSSRTGPRGPRPASTLGS